VKFADIDRSQWPLVAAALAAESHIDRLEHEGAQLFFGILSFIRSDGRPYSIASAQDMPQLGFPPLAGGTLTDTLDPTALHAAAASGVGRRARRLADAFVDRV
jgi:hypothetical protein